MKLSRPSSDAVAGLALLVSAVALAVSLFEVYDNHKTSYAAVKPIVHVSFEYRKDGSGWILLNKGVGPAIFKWFEVLVDGSPVPTWDHVAYALEFPRKTGMQFAVPTRGTYSVNDEVKIFWVEPGEAEKKLRKSAQRVRFRYCFCSVQEECWIRTEVEAVPTADCGALRATSLGATRGL